MTSGRPASDLLCSAHNRAGGPCGNAAVPFTDPRICRRHGGLAPQVLKKAERRADDAERGMTGLPPAVVRQQLAAWHKVQERLARKQMRKSGVLADWEQAAEQMRIEQRERERALRDLAPTYVAAERERAAEVQRWAATGRRGPMPALTADEEPEGLSAGVRGLLEPATEPEPTAEPELATEPEPTAEPELATEPERPAVDREEQRRRWRAEADAEHARHRVPESPQAPFLERRGEQRRTARKPARSASVAGKTLPGGGKVYEDVQAVPAARYQARSVEPVYPAGFDIDWADLV